MRKLKNTKTQREREGGREWKRRNYFSGNDHKYFNIQQKICRVREREISLIKNPHFMFLFRTSWHEGLLFLRVTQQNSRHTFFYVLLFLQKQQPFHYFFTPLMMSSFAFTFSNRFSIFFSYFLVFFTYFSSQIHTATTTTTMMMGTYFHIHIWLWLWIIYLFKSGCKKPANVECFATKKKYYTLLFIPLKPFLLLV